MTNITITDKELLTSKNREKIESGNSSSNNDISPDQHQIAKKISSIAKDTFKPFGINAGCHLLESQGTGHIKCIHVVLIVESIEAIIFRAFTVTEMLKKITCFHDYLLDLEKHNTESFAKDILAHLAKKAKAAPELAIVVFELESSLKKLHYILSQKLHVPVIYSDLQH